MTINHEITAQTLILDVLTWYPTAQELLAEYDHLAGGCLCCEALFDSVAEVAARCDLPADQLLTRLRQLAHE